MLRKIVVFLQHITLQTHYPMLLWYYSINFCHGLFQKPTQDPGGENHVKNRGRNWERNIRKAVCWRTSGFVLDLFLPSVFNHVLLVPASYGALSLTSGRWVAGVLLLPWWASGAPTVNEPQWNKTTTIQIASQNAEQERKEEHRTYKQRFTWS